MGRKVLESFTEQEEIDIKTKEYLEYINKHLFLLYRAFEEEILPIGDRNNISKYFSDREYIDAINKCEENLPLHDLSKRSKEEFESYRKRFYPTEKEKLEFDSIKKDFHNAWVHHYKNNPHHVEYWCTDGLNPERDMELCYILELYCDWKSVSILKGGNPYKFYISSEERKMMTEKTRKVLEELFSILGYS